MRNMETIVNGLITGLQRLETHVNNSVGQIVQFIQNFQQAVRLDSTGKEIRL